MREHVDTIVLGGGQAGLAMSAVLTRHDREHVVLERGRIAQRWRTERWDSLRFQFPNWSLQLPGYAYSGDDPDGFATSADISRIIGDYAAAMNAPIREATEVVGLDGRDDHDGFVITTSDGVLEAERVVLATGPFQLPFIPDLAKGIPSSVHQTDPTRPGIGIPLSCRRVRSWSSVAVRQALRSPMSSTMPDAECSCQLAVIGELRAGSPARTCTGGSNGRVASPRLSTAFRLASGRPGFSSPASTAATT